MNAKVVRIPRYTNEAIEVVKEIDLSQVKAITTAEKAKYVGILVIYTEEDEFGLNKIDTFFDDEEYAYSIFVDEQIPEEL